MFLSLSAVDLLEKMLDLDSDKRLTAEQALAHEYLATYSDPDDEVIMIGILFLLTGWETLCLSRHGELSDRSYNANNTSNPDNNRSLNS